MNNTKTVNQLFVEAASELKNRTDLHMPNVFTCILLCVAARDSTDNWKLVYDTRYRLADEYAEILRERLKNIMVSFGDMGEPIIESDFINDYVDMLSQYYPYSLEDKDKLRKKTRIGWLDYVIEQCKE